MDQVFDLFDNQGATDEQLDFPIVYTSAMNGIAGPIARYIGRRHAATIWNHCQHCWAAASGYRRRVSYADL